MRSSRPGRSRIPSTTRNRSLAACGGDRGSDRSSGVRHGHSANGIGCLGPEGATPKADIGAAARRTGFSGMSEGEPLVGLRGRPAWHR